MPLVAKHLDIIIGVDIHITIFPPPPAGPGPIPLPYPFMAMIFDPMDWVPMIGATVKVNNMPRATASTQGMLAVPPLHHIPYGIGFLLEVMMGNDQKMFFGGAKTHAEGALLSAGPYMVMSCNDFGMPLSIKPGKNWKPIPSLYLPLSSSIPLPMGMPVNLNDPLVPDWSSMIKDMLIGAAFGYALKGAGSLLTRFNHFLKGTKMGESNPISRALCHLGFEPVDLVRGNVVSYVTDFELPGPIPLVWERQYSSNSFFEGSMGARWCTQYHQYMRYNPAEASFDWFTPDGREMLVPDLPYGESLFAKSERCTFYHDEKGVRYFNHKERLWYYFDSAMGDKNFYRLARIARQEEPGIQLSYNFKGHLKEIIDSAGRILFINTDAAGRIVQLLLNEPGNPRQMVAYRYSEENDLVEVLDTFNKATKIRYQHHLMVEKTDRNGEKFFWQYDSDEQTARCTHTFGEHNLMKGKLVYEPDRTIVFDALGNRSELVHAGGLVIEEIDAFGFSKKHAYNESMELIQDEDELERKTLYAYDFLGNRIATTSPDGNKMAAAYNENGLIEMTLDGGGGITIYNYDERGLLIRMIYPDRRVLQYAYDDQGMLGSITTATGQEIEIKYDAYYNRVGMKYPDGRTKSWKYDYAGNCIQTTLANGAVERYDYDPMGRLTAIAAANDNYIRIEYDAYDSARKVKDKLSTVEMEYNPLGRLTKRRQGDSVIEFFYNCNNELTSVKNEAGESYYFKYGSNGRLIEETGFDGIKRQFIRNEAGELITMVQPDGELTTYEHDGAGRITSVSYADGTACYYEYDGAGRLVGAVNEHAQIKLVRDAGGRVTKEILDDVEIIRSYNVLGLPTDLQSSLGADFKYTYNDWGHLEKITGSAGADTWLAQLQNDINGFELQRNLPGEAMLRYERDQTGKPIEQILTTPTRPDAGKRYGWSAGSRLHNVADLQEGNFTTFQYNPAGHLIGSIGSSQQTAMPAHTLRTADEVGNYYETADKRDRRYGPSGRLLWKSGNEYFYNEQGNLIEKRGIDGKSSKYSYYAGGLLRSIIIPDGRQVQFTYDALGRRISKKVGHKITRWVWNGNVPLHEWQENDDAPTTIKPDGSIGASAKEKVVAWMFEPNRFIPCAKITEAGTYSIVTDHLGTPTHMIDKNGKVAWQAKMDIYGRTTISVGKKEDLPFRYQGQYEDVETGLYYNRFRYYSPEEGMYVTQQDPIRLNGGFTMYGYVFDPNTWIDLLGLTGTYMFTDGTTWYVGKGPADRMYTSMGQRVGGSGNVTQGLHVDYGSNDTGLMTEAELMRRNSAVTDPDFANAINSPGEKMLADAQKNNPALYKDITQKADDFEKDFNKVKGIKCK